MRTAGIVLVILGALALGVQSFDFPRTEPAARVDSLPRQNNQNNANYSGLLPAILGGIALVSGLLLIVIDGKQESDS